MESNQNSYDQLIEKIWELHDYCQMIEEKRLEELSSDDGDDLIDILSDMQSSLRESIRQVKRCESNDV